MAAGVERAVRVRRHIRAGDPIALSRIAHIFLLIMPDFSVTAPAQGLNIKEGQKPPVAAFATGWTQILPALVAVALMRLGGGVVSVAGLAPSPVEGALAVRHLIGGGHRLDGHHKKADVSSCPRSLREPNPDGEALPVEAIAHVHPPVYVSRDHTKRSPSSPFSRFWSPHAQRLTNSSDVLAADRQPKPSSHRSDGVHQMRCRFLAALTEGPVGLPPGLTEGIYRPAFSPERDSRPERSSTCGRPEPNPDRP